MKSTPEIIDTLNFLLSDELTAINQYFVHAEMCADWGYEELKEVIKKRAITEMRHAETHIERILFLEGTPIVSNLNKINIGANVETQLKNDHTAEGIAIKGYNDGIRLCEELGDNGTREIFQNILVDEEAHIDWIEAQLDQISQMGIQLYLSEQTG